MLLYRSKTLINKYTNVCIYVCIYVCTYVSMYLCIYVRMYLYMYVWMDGWMDGWIDGWMDRWMDRWVDGWVDGWMDGWMDGWRRDKWIKWESAEIVLLRNSRNDDPERQSVICLQDEAAVMKLMTNWGNEYWYVRGWPRNNGEISRWTFWLVPCSMACTEAVGRCLDLKYNQATCS